MSKALKNTSPRRDVPPFSNLPMVCSNAISEILNQDFQDDVLDDFIKVSDLKQRDTHLKVIAHYLNIATMGEVASASSIPTGEKLLAFDLANFFLKKQSQSSSQDAGDYREAEGLGYSKSYLCKAAGAGDEFINGFISEKKLNISEKNLDAYKAYFRASTKQLINKVSEFAINCDYGKKSEYLNYFREVDSLKEKRAGGEELTFIERVKSQSSLCGLREEKLAESDEINGGRKRTSHDGDGQLSNSDSIAITDGQGASKRRSPPEDENSLNVISLADRSLATTPMANLVKSIDSGCTVTPSPVKPSPVRRQVSFSSGDEVTKEAAQDLANEGLPIVASLSIPIQNHSEPSTVVSANEISAFRVLQQTKDKNIL